MTDLIQSFCLVALTFVMAYQAFWFRFFRKELHRLLSELYRGQREVTRQSSESAGTDISHEPTERVHSAAQPSARPSQALEGGREPCSKTGRQAR